MALEANEQTLQTGKAVAVACCAECREELHLLNKKLNSLVAEFWKMQKQPVEPIPPMKSEVDKNMQIVLDSSFLAHAFVGVLIGVFVTSMWK